MYSKFKSILPNQWLLAGGMVVTIFLLTTNPSLFLGIGLAIACFIFSSRRALMFIVNYISEDYNAQVACGRRLANIFESFSAAGLIGFIVSGFSVASDNFPNLVDTGVVVVLASFYISICITKHIEEYALCNKDNQSKDGK